MKDGEVTYKKFEVGQLMGSIQLGIHNSVGNLNTEVGMEMQILGQNIFSVLVWYFFCPFLLLYGHVLPVIFIIRIFQVPKGGKVA